MARMASFGNAFANTGKINHEFLEKIRCTKLTKPTVKFSVILAFHNYLTKQFGISNKVICLHYFKMFTVIQFKKFEKLSNLK